MKFSLKNKRFFKLLLIVLLVLTTASFVALPILAQNYGLDETARAAKLTGFGTAETLPQKIGLVLFGILSFMGIIFLVIVIYGGFLWMTAGGNTEQTKKASSMIKNGVIGVIIIALSFGLTSFIFNTILANSGTAGTGSSDPCQAATGRPTGCACSISNPSQCVTNSCQFSPNPSFSTCQ